MIITKTKEQIFGFIKDKIRKKMDHWKTKLLSLAGKETLLKAVTMAIPTNAMSCYKLPKKLCKEICSMMVRCLWGQNDQKNKQH